jgi:hypothetical protein
LLFHCEAYKNLLCAFVHVSKMVYNTEGTIHKDINVNLCKEIETHLVSRRDAIALGYLFGYNVEMDNNNYIVTAPNLRSNQFPLGKTSSMATIYETRSKNPRDEGMTQRQMTTANEFEFAHTLCSKMAQIKVTKVDKKIDSLKFNVQLNTTRTLKGHCRNSIRHYFEMKHTCSN